MLGVRHRDGLEPEAKTDAVAHADRVREAGKPKFDGRVEIDDAYQGRGTRRQALQVANAAGKTPFVAAVETTADKKRADRLRLKVVKGFRKQEIAKLAKADIACRRPRSKAMGCPAGQRSPRRAASIARLKRARAKRPFQTWRTFKWWLLAGSPKTEIHKRVIN